GAQSSEQIDLERGNTQSRLILRADPDVLVAGHGDSAGGVDGRQLLRPLDVKLLARSCDVGRGNHQVAIVRERLSDQGAQTWVLKDLAVGEDRQANLRLREI